MASRSNKEKWPAPEKAKTKPKKIGEGMDSPGGPHTPGAKAKRKAEKEKEKKQDY